MRKPKQIGLANLVGARNEGASSPLISRVLILSRRKVLSLADADGPGADTVAAFACCSLRLDG
jgi:hypothetical protein